MKTKEMENTADDVVLDDKQLIGALTKTDHRLHGFFKEE